MSSVSRFEFEFAAPYRLPAMTFGITPRTAWVQVSEEEFRVRFGPWSLVTPLDNISRTQVTGGYSFVKTAGPAHLSFTDHGVTFATNGDEGLCIQFHRPVRGIDPTGTIRHPGATVTVADIDGLRAAIGR